jgi:endonuclease/exonuclease/phosphatase family metal-dependent hydrolase
MSACWLVRRGMLAVVITAAVLAAACTPAVPRAEEGSQLLHVISYNIRHGRGMDEVVDLERTARLLRSHNPDIVALQEVDERVTRSGRVAQADSLGKLLGMQAAFGSFFDYQGGQYGMAVLSRFPITRIDPIRLPDGNEPRIALMVHVATPAGDTIAVVNVHFDWVSNDTFRFAQATALTRVLDTLRMPYVVVGDFNDVPESRTLALFGARATEARKPRESRFTFPSPVPVKEIDFLFAAPARAWSIGEVRVIDERMASDHRPVRVELRRRRP